MKKNWELKVIIGENGFYIQGPTFPKGKAHHIIGCVTRALHILIEEAEGIDIRTGERIIYEDPEEFHKKGKLK